MKSLCVKYIDILVEILFFSSSNDIQVYFQRKVKKNFYKFNTEKAKERLFNKYVPV